MTTDNIYLELVNASLKMTVELDKYIQQQIAEIIKHRGIFESSKWIIECSAPQFSISEDHEPQTLGSLHLFKYQIVCNVRLIPKEEQKMNK